MQLIILDGFRTQKTFGLSPGEGAAYFQDRCSRRAWQGLSPEWGRARAPRQPLPHPDNRPLACASSDTKGSSSNLTGSRQESREHGEGSKADAKRTTKTDFRRGILFPSTLRPSSCGALAMVWETVHHLHCFPGMACSLFSEDAELREHRFWVKSLLFYSLQVWHSSWTLWCI